MGRKRRESVPDAYHHVYCRGNNRENIFHDEIDMIEVFRLFKMIHEDTPISISAFCIMTNHYHFLLKPGEASISKIMGTFSKRYTDYYNRRYDRVGHVFQQRFNSSPIIDSHGILQVSKYIHRNPINTNPPIVPKMEDYHYSSYHYYKNSIEPPYPYINLHDIPALLPDQNIQLYCKYAETADEETQFISKNW